MATGEKTEDNDNLNVEYQPSNKSGKQTQTSGDGAGHSSDVKSTAVVKYTSVKTPAKFCKLQINTNLNDPPSNWLRRQGAKFGVKGPWTIRNNSSKEFSRYVATTCYQILHTLWIIT